MNQNKVAPDSYPPPAYGGPGVYPPGPPPAYPPGPPPAYPATDQQGFSYSNTTTVQTSTSGMIHEPAPMVIQREPKPNNYMLLSLITLGCFSPLCGIFALFMSLQSNSAYERGDVEEARRKGLLARNISIFAIILGCISIVIAIIVIVINFAIIPTVVPRY